MKQWEAHRVKIAAFVEQYHGIDAIEKELTRGSTFRNEAMDAGMIRPFLLLVSMDYSARNQVASLCGFSIYNQEYLGNPHAEAWDILNAPLKGIRKRATESWETLNPLANNANWYETVYRCGTEVFKKLDSADIWNYESLEPCKVASKAGVVRGLEDEFLTKLSRLQAVQMTQEQLTALSQLEDSDEVRQIARNMREAGIDSPALIRYGVNTVYQAIRFGGFNSYILTVKIAAAMNRNLGTKIMMAHATKSVARFTAVLNAVGWIWLAADVLDLVVGSSHGRVFPAIVQILNQKVILAAEGISIDRYY